MNNTYDYMEAIENDVLDYIKEEINLTDWENNRDGLEEHLNDVLWDNDNVTGNSCGTYTCDREKAREYVIDNLELVTLFADEFCVSNEELGKHFREDDWEWFDVSIRCYELSTGIHFALDTLFGEEYNI